MDYLMKKKIRRAYPWTTKKRVPAISLYTRYGFRLTWEKTSDLFGKGLTEQSYDLNLN